MLDKRSLTQKNIYMMIPLEQGKLLIYFLLIVRTIPRGAWWSLGPCPAMQGIHVMLGLKLGDLE